MISDGKCSIITFQSHVFCQRTTFAQPGRGTRTEASSVLASSFSAVLAYDTEVEVGTTTCVEVPAYHVYTRYYVQYWSTTVPLEKALCLSLVFHITWGFAMMEMQGNALHFQDSMCACHLINKGLYIKEYRCCRSLISTDTSTPIHHDPL